MCCIFDCKVEHSLNDSWGMEYLVILRSVNLYRSSIRVKGFPLEDATFGLGQVYTTLVHNSILNLGVTYVWYMLIQLCSKPL